MTNLLATAIVATNLAGTVAVSYGYSYKWHHPKSGPVQLQIVHRTNEFRTTLDGQPVDFRAVTPIATNYQPVGLTNWFIIGPKQVRLLQLDMETNSPARPAIPR